MDGFPRTLGQAMDLDKHLQNNRQKLDFVVNLDVPEDVILDRIMSKFKKGKTVFYFFFLVSIVASSLIFNSTLFPMFFLNFCNFRSLDTFIECK